MVFKPTAFLAVLGVSVLICLPAQAEGHDASEAVCRDQAASAEERITACSTLLDDYAYTDLTDYAITHLSRAQAYRDVRNYEPALADLDTVLDYDPFAFDGYMTRGEVLLATGEAFRAIADFTVAIGLEPLRSDPYAWRGTALYANREYPEAQRDLESALGFDPEDTRAMTTLAWILAAAPDKGQRDGARALALTEAINADAEDASGPLKLVRAAALAESGDTASALDIYGAMMAASDRVSERFGRYLVAAGHLSSFDAANDPARLSEALHACLADGCRVGAPLPRL